MIHSYSWGGYNVIPLKAIMQTKKNHKRILSSSFDCGSYLPLVLREETA